MFSPSPFLLRRAIAHTSPTVSCRHRLVFRPRVQALEDRTLPSGMSPPLIPSPSGMVSWWAGDDSAVDLAGPNPGTLNNGVTYFQGEVADAFKFDTTDYVSAGTIGLPTGSADRTLEMWVKVNSFGAAEAYFAGYGHFGSSSQTYHLGTASDHRLFFSQWGQAIFGPALQAGQWYHIAVTNSGNSETLYLNGASVASGSLTINTPTGSSFYIGRIAGSLGDTRLLNGEVDEVSVYNRALSASEIQSIYQAGVDGKDKSYMVVDQSSPSEGDIATAAPTDFTIDFSNPFDTSTLQASDLTVNNIAADSVAVVDANTATFHFDTSPASAAGVQTMQMAAGAVQASNGISDPALRAWSKTFTYAPSALLQVTSTSPPDGGFMDLENTTLTVNFSGAYDPATAGTDDLVLSQGQVASFSLTSATSVTYLLAGVSEGKLTVSMPAGALTDLQGNPLLAYTGTYQVDVSTAPFPTPLALQNPAGSLIYQGAVTGYWNPMGTTTGDLDSFTLAVDANQTLTLRVNSLAQALVTVSHSVQGNVALPPDQDPGPGSLFQIIPISAAGTLTIGIQAPNAATTGTYILQATLNGQMDQGYGDTVIVQSLDAGMIDVEPGPVTVNRAGVLGSVGHAAPRILTETEGVTNDLRGSWDEKGTSPSWTINARGNPHTRLYRGVVGSLDTTGSNTDATDTYSFSGSAGDVVTIRSWASNGGGGTLSITNVTLQAPDGTQTAGTAVIGAASDNIIQSFMLPSTGTYLVIVGTSGARKGTYTLTADLRTPFNPRPNTTDLYSLTVGAPGYVSFAAATGNQAVDQARVQLALYAPGVDPLTGSPLATSTTSGLLDAWLEYNAAVAGVYTVKVTPGPGLSAGTVNYGLVAIANGSFDNSSNEGFTTAQDMAGRAAVLGYLEQSGANFHKMTLTAGQTVVLSTSTPADGPGEFRNSLDPHLELYDANQALVATGTPLADGRNEQITYTVAVAGTYYVRVSAENSTQGEYVLDPVVQSATIRQRTPTSIPLMPLSDRQAVTDAHGSEQAASLEGAGPHSAAAAPNLFLAFLETPRDPASGGELPTTTEPQLQMQDSSFAALAEGSATDPRTVGSTTLASHLLADLPMLAWSEQALSGPLCPAPSWGWTGAGFDVSTAHMALR